MRFVENVLSHWIDLYSSSRTEVEYDDHIFHFGLNTPQDILVTTSLSALTLGVDMQEGFLGTIGTRIYHYWYYNKAGALTFKQNPPAYEWNSDYIDRCVAVRVRTAVFFATGTSLSNVYIFSRNGSNARPLDGFKHRRAVASAVRENGVTKTHRTTIFGPAAALAEDTDFITAQLRTESAAVLKVKEGQIDLALKNGRPPRRALTAKALAALGIRHGGLGADNPATDTMRSSE